MSDREPRAGRATGARRRARRARPISALLGVIVAVLVVAAAAHYHRRTSAPGPAVVLAKMRRAGEEVAELACVLRSPWPEAYPAAAGQPGARVLLAPAETVRAWSVSWKASIGFRAEALEPPGAAGSLTVAAGGRWWTYNPTLGLALSGEGKAPSLFLEEIVDLLAAGTGLQVAGRSEVAGRPTYTVTAAVGENCLVVDVDRAVWLPLRARLTGEGGRVLAELEVHQLELNPGLDREVFEFEPPPGTRVLGGASPRAYADVAAAAGELSFDPKLPGWTPEGFRLSAVNVTGEGRSRALVLTWTPETGVAGSTGGVISLTQAPAGPEYAPLPYGRPEERGAVKAMVFELGEMYVVDWRLGDLSLTLFGSVPLTQLLDVAVSVR